MPARLHKPKRSKIARLRKSRARQAPETEALRVDVAAPPSTKRDAPVDSTPSPMEVEISEAPVAAPPSSASFRRRRRFGSALGTLTVLAGVLLALASYALRDVLKGAPLGADKWKSIAMRIVHAVRPEPPRAPSPAAEIAATPRADERLDRTFIGHIPGGVVFLPSTFSSADGAYDLLLHFHGNTKVVAESAERAGLNAVVAVVNLGINSAPYEDAYQVPGVYEQLLEDVNHQVAEKGLKTPHLRRLALSSWSGGYGALSTILETRKGTEPLDAIAVLDGIHCGYLDDREQQLNTLKLLPFLRAAKKAAEGKILFTITHSYIDPVGYAGTYKTARYLVSEVHGEFAPANETYEHVALKAAEGAVAKRLEKFMEPTVEAKVGSFHVRGFKGNTPEHHMAHLLQMATTVLPELAARWENPPKD